MSRKTKKIVLSNMETAAFCNQMAMGLGAGFSVLEAISLLQADAQGDQEKTLLDALYEAVLVSGQLHPALQEVGGFPEYMVHMTEIAEATGKLDEVMASLAVYYDREETISHEIRSALTYPMVIAAVMLLVILILLTKVMPVFEQVFTELGRQMTGLSRAMLTLGNAISDHAIVILVVLAVLVLAAVCFARSLRKEGPAVGLIRHFRVFGRTYDKIAACRFAGCMHLALKSGMGAHKGMDMAQGLIDNPAYVKKINACRKAMEGGAAAGEAIMQAQLFGRRYAQMAVIADKSGRMDEMMEQIADQYQDEIDAEIGSAIALIEPTIVIILSVIVGIVLLSVMLPLMGIMAEL